MKICAWDVGIKNLAFCMIEKIDDKITIKHWNVINIIAGDVGDAKKPKQTCCNVTVKTIRKIETNVQCKKTASYVGVNAAGVEQHYCKSHMGNHQPTNIQAESFVGNEACKFKSKTPCKKNATFLIKGEHYCTTHKAPTIKKLTNAVIVRKIKKAQRCTSLDPQILATKLTESLDKLYCINDIMTCDEIVIENQPAYLNSSMKSMASMLFYYFIIRGNVKRIKYVAAQNKLKVKNDGSVAELKAEIKAEMEAETKTAEDTNKPAVNETKITGNGRVKKVAPNLSKKETANKRKVYLKTKEQGTIDAMKVLEKEDANALELLKNHDKKDDMCDSFLLGYHYLCKK